MVDRWAVATGNWSAPATWNGGASIPASGDDVYSNTFTVTIDQNITAKSLRNLSGTGIAAGGQFQVTTGTRTITVTDGISGTTHASTSTPSLAISGGTVILTAALTGGNISGRHALAISGGNVTVNGAVLGGSNGNARAVHLSGGTTVFYGGVTGATGAGLYVVSGSPDITVTGNVAGSTSSAPLGHGIHLAGGTPALTITGDVSGGINCNGIFASVGSIRVGGGTLRWGFGGAAPIDGDGNATTSTERVMFKLATPPTVT